MSVENMIDSFHRRLLRTACLNVQWPKIIKNEKLYEITKAIPWSTVVKKRQLSWFGHLMRLPEETPAKLSLQHVLHHPISKQRGRQPTTWISMMKKRFKDYDIDWEEASVLAEDRLGWNNFVRSHCDP